MVNEPPESRPEHEEISAEGGGEMTHLKRLIQQARVSTRDRLQNLRPQLERFLRLNYGQTLVELLADSDTD